MAAKTQELPEEVVLDIFSRLSIKSLIRFSCVSKRMHSIIFFDPIFARSHFKAARLSRRLLIIPRVESVYASVVGVESLQLDDTPSFGDPSSVRKLALPLFLQQTKNSVKLLGSCNGLVFVAVDDTIVHVWNPSLGLFKKLPDTGFVFPNKTLLYYFGDGYVSAADDYRVLLGFFHLREGKLKFKLFSMRSHTWETIESPAKSYPHDQGILFNETLHWLEYSNASILCFDLAVKKFRTMPLPEFDNYDGEYEERYLGVFGGYLCVTRYPGGVCESIWGMREYGVRDSWTVLFSFKRSYRPHYLRTQLMVSGTTVAAEYVVGVEFFKLVRVDHERGLIGQYVLKGSRNRIDMVEYEERLLWISGYRPEEEPEQLGPDTQNRSQGLTKLNRKDQLSATLL